MKLKTWALLGALAMSSFACGDGDDVPDRNPDDVMMDAGNFDAGPLDARVPEGGRPDAS
ncbi:MAG: hypothetical protein ABW352_19030 [Polyangiales bacterium]